MIQLEKTCPTKGIAESRNLLPFPAQTCACFREKHGITKDYVLLLADG
jgi:hypothetical protein